MTLYKYAGEPLNRARLERTREFLLNHGLRMEDDADYLVCLYDEDGRMMATGSLCANVLKYIAVADEAQGEGACATVVSELVSQAYRQGLKKLFLFTKPSNEAMFKSLGFYPIARTADTMMMENSRNGLDLYLASLPRADGTAGAIVANCNPLTNGHLYLMEQAAKRVDALHIFVLSEDRSLYSADARYDLVKRGAQHIKNAYIHHSGDYLISSATFPAYFIKEGADARQINADLDIALFGSRIAPPLNIKYRFVGTEPYCPVTSAYNERMKQLLPQYGIEVVELQRLDGISASQVRALADQGRWDQVAGMVPKVTLDYLMGYGNK